MSVIRKRIEFLFGLGYSHDFQDEVEQIESALKLQELVKERMKEGGRYQPEIIRRKEGLLDMRDVVDKMRDDEYHIYKSLLEQSQTTLKEGVKE